jgi:CO/xanthine dehydrogenase Mo-binding subunit
MPSASGAYLRLNDDGTGTLITGAQENGSGAVMGLAILAAQVLGMQAEDFSLVHQDTEAGPWDGGSEGSQTTFNSGRAVVAAAEAIRDQLLELAAEELEIDAADLELADGELRARGTGVSVPIATLVRRARESGRLVLGHGSGTAPAQPAHDVGASVGRFALGAFTAPTFFAHAARVHVDRDTGVTRVLAVAAAHDFGRVINPAGATGQVHGGVMHGIGMALTERTAYADGRQLNPYLLDYKLQTAADAPRIDVAFIEAPTSNGGPFGSKGVGEPPMVPTCGAVGNAIAAATGVRVHRLPMTAERVWEALAS